MPRSTTSYGEEGLSKGDLIPANLSLSKHCSKVSSSKHFVVKPGSLKESWK